MELLVVESARCDDAVDELVDSTESLVDGLVRDDAAAAGCAAIDAPPTATTTEERDRAAQDAQPTTGSTISFNGMHPTEGRIERRISSGNAR